MALSVWVSYNQILAITMKSMKTITCFSYCSSVGMLVGEDQMAL